MLARFATNLLLLLAGAFALVATFALSRTADIWLLFALGCTATIVSLWGFGLRERGTTQRVLDLTAAVAGSFLIIASRSFSSPTARWLGFGLSAGLVALSVIGLLVREIVLVRLHALPRTAG